MSNVTNSTNVTNRTKAVMTFKKVKCAIPREKSLQIWLISLCWALSLHVDKPLKSDTWPVRCKINKLVTFPAAGHHQQYANTHSNADTASI